MYVKQQRTKHCMDRSVRTLQMHWLPNACHIGESSAKRIKTVERYLIVQSQVQDIDKA